MPDQLPDISTWAWEGFLKYIFYSTLDGCCLHEACRLRFFEDVSHRVVQKSLSYAQVEIGILFHNAQNMSLGHTSDRDSPIRHTVT